ncbi:MAG: hypothetical protein LBK66_15225 [Spirochaetaceae bacterium]|jgi:hypothetical protein|nr:hypothetical protein [Spirochaetaceae bacterium]
MTGGTISGNIAGWTGGPAAGDGGGGVYVTGNSTFVKTGGIIYGDEDTTPYITGNGKSTDNTAVSGNGHAVRVKIDENSGNKRNVTLGKDDDLSYVQATGAFVGAWD